MVVVVASLVGTGTAAAWGSVVGTGIVVAGAGTVVGTGIVVEGSGGSVVVEAGILTVVVGATLAFTLEAWLLPQLAEIRATKKTSKVF